MKRNVLLSLIITTLLCTSCLGTTEISCESIVFKSKSNDFEETHCRESQIHFPLYEYQDNNGKKTYLNFYDQAYENNDTFYFANVVVYSDDTNGQSEKKTSEVKPVRFVGWLERDQEIIYEKGFNSRIRFERTYSLCQCKDDEVALDDTIYQPDNQEAYEIASNEFYEDWGICTMTIFCGFTHSESYASRAVDTTVQRMGLEKVEIRELNEDFCSRYEFFYTELTK